MSKPRVNSWMKHRPQLRPKSVHATGSNQYTVLKFGVTAVFFPRLGEQDDSMREVWSNTLTRKARYFMFTKLIDETYIHHYVYGITKTQLKKRGLCGHRVLCSFKIKLTPSGHLVIELEPCGNKPHIQMTHSIRYASGATGNEVCTAPSMNGVGIRLTPPTQAARAA